MIIRHSRIRVFLFYLSILFLGGLLSVTFLQASFEMNQKIILSLIIATPLAIILALSQFDIEVDELKIMMGGPSLSKKRVGIIKKLTRVQFVKGGDVDKSRSLNRSFIDKLFGIIRIYDKNGEGFIIYDCFFSSNNSEKIRLALVDIYLINEIA